MRERTDFHNESDFTRDLPSPLRSSVFLPLARFFFHRFFVTGFFIRLTSNGCFAEDLDEERFSGTESAERNECSTYVGSKKERDRLG